MLVRYLSERRPAVDYSTFRALSSTLVGRFWADFEQHHPGIDTLDLPDEVAKAWKERLDTVTIADGEQRARSNRFDVLLRVLRDATGQALRYTPHDFRRMFATEAVGLGLPVHIAAKLLGHRNINTTQGYVAVFQDHLIQTYRQLLDRRRALRPSAEYREPTAQEWTEFQQHFEQRKVSLGTCARPYGTPCHHRTRLRPLPRSARRPPPAEPTARHRQEPERPHQRGPAERLDRRGPGTTGQPGRSPRQGDRTEPQPNNANRQSHDPRHASDQS